MSNGEWGGVVLVVKWGWGGVVLVVKWGMRWGSFGCQMGSGVG